jgi:hypothetical protein
MDKPTLASVLMGVEDDPITKRGMLWPRVERQSGKAELGWPSFLKEPWDALQRLSAGGYQPGTGDEQGVKDSFTLAGALTGGGLGLNWAGQVPKGALGSAGGRLPTQKGITAYHGSPHDFDRFDSSKIGTGEGAQAYGHGLYFAENEGVARSYKDALAQHTVGGKPFDDLNPQHWAAAELAIAKGDKNAAIAEISSRIEKLIPAYDGGERARLLRARGMLQRGEELPKAEHSGKMYEVRINADPESFLDWDKPLKGQPANDKIRAYVDEIKKLGLEDDYKDFLSAAEMTGMPGEWFARAATNGMKNATPALSADLKAAGIPGIKYLDQGSRAGGEGTRNYVVFDADKIEILKKYGWVPAGMVGGGMMMTPPDGQEGF